MKMDFSKDELGHGLHFPLRWLPPATPLWTCWAETPCFANCLRSVSFIETSYFLTK